MNAFSMKPNENSHGIESKSENFVFDSNDAQNGQNPKNGHSIFHQMHGEGARYFEAQTLPRILHDRPGLVSMINNGKDNEIMYL